MDSECIKGVIDRFEGLSAIVEINGKMEKIPRDKLPQNASEGSYIEIRAGIITLNETAASSARARAAYLLKDLK